MTTLSNLFNTVTIENNATMNSNLYLEGNLIINPDPLKLNNAYGEWIQLQFSQSHSISAYQLAPKYTSLESNITLYQNRMIKSWLLVGSNDFNVWTLLDNQRNYTNWTCGICKTFTLSQPASYNYYRLIITQLSGFDNYCNIGGFILLDNDMNPIIPSISQVAYHGYPSGILQLQSNFNIIANYSISWGFNITDIPIEDSFYYIFTSDCYKNNNSYCSEFIINNNILYSSTNSYIAATGTSTLVYLYKTLGLIGIGTNNPQHTLDVVGTFNITGDITSTSNLNISGLTLLNSDTTLLSSLNISGFTIINASTTLLSNLNVSGYTLLNNTVSLLSSLNVQGQVNLENSLTVSGPVILNNLNVAGLTNLYGNILISGTTTINSGLNVNGPLNVLGSINTVNYNIVQNKISIISTFTVSGATLLNSTLNTIDAVTFLSSLHVSGSTEIDNSLIVSGNTTLLSKLIIYDDVSLLSNLYVSDNLFIQGNINLNGSISIEKMNINQDLTISGITNLKSSLIVNDNTTLLSNLYVQENIYVNELLINSNLSVLGSISSNNSLSINNINNNGYLNISGNTTLNSSLYVNGSTILNSTNINNNLKVLGISNLGNNFLVTNNGVTISSTLDINGNINFTGQLCQDGAIYSPLPFGNNFGQYLYWNNGWQIGNNDIKCGNNSGETNQSNFAIAIGYNSGNTNQGPSSIAIGKNASYSISNISNGTYTNWITNGNIPNNNYKNIIISNNGMYQLTYSCSNNNNLGYIFLSIDSGQTFNQLTFLGNRIWSSIGISGNGKYMITSYLSGIVSISSDYGFTWSSIYKSGLPERITWNTISISHSGQYILMAGDTYIVISYNYGNTWIQIDSLDTLWNSSAISYNGTYMLLCSNNYIYISSNFGSDWKHLIINSELLVYNKCAMSYSGHNIIISTLTSTFISSNYGKSWITTILPNNCNALSMSCTGQYIIVNNINSYYSTDYGNTWIIIEILNNNYGCAISNDGTYISLTSTCIYSLNNNSSGNSIAIGNEAGYLNQGTNSIAIGYKAGCENQSNDSIILNATNNKLNSFDNNSLYISPINTIEKSTTKSVKLLGYGSDNQVLQTSIYSTINNENIIIYGTWAQIQLTTPSSIISYAIAPRNTYANLRTPTSWHLVGSNDGITWIIIDEQNQQINTWSNDAPNIYTLKNPTNIYIYYRIIFTSFIVVGTNNIMDIGGFYLYPPDSISPLFPLKLSLDPFISSNNSYHITGTFYNILQLAERKVAILTCSWFSNNIDIPDGDINKTYPPASILVNNSYKNFNYYIGFIGMSNYTNNVANTTATKTIAYINNIGTINIPFGNLLLSNGSIGINTLKPLSNLHVVMKDYNTSELSNMAIFGQNNNNVVGIGYNSITGGTIICNKSLNYNAPMHIFNNNIVCSTLGAGNLTTNSHGLIVSSSDKRIKNNIVYLDNNGELDKLMKIKPTTYKRNDDLYKKYTGFIAQDIELIYPDAVDGKKYEYMYESIDGKPLTDISGNIIYKYDDNGEKIIRPKTLDTNALLCHTIMALQELKYKYDELEKKYEKIIAM